jgi:hypothetical protein
MADPGTIMMIAGAVSAVAGTGLSAVSSYGQAKTQAALSRQSAQYAFAVAERNKQLADLQVAQAKKAGEYQAGLITEQAQKLRAKQIAMFGASGVDLEGSPSLFIEDTAAQAARDAEMAIYTGNYDAWRATQSSETSLLEGRAAGARYLTEADVYGSKGDMVLLSGGVNAIGKGLTILTGWGKNRIPAWSDAFPNPGYAVA